MARRPADPCTAGRLKRAARCPDCASTVTVHRTGPVLYQVSIAHDDTCPWYRRVGAGRPFSMLSVLR